MSAELIAVISVGVALAGLMLTGLRAVRVEVHDLRVERTMCGDLFASGWPGWRACSKDSLAVSRTEPVRLAQTSVGTMRHGTSPSPERTP